MLRTEYDRRIEEEQRAYKLLESQIRTQSRELEALKYQRVEVLNEWEAERASQRAKEDAWAQSKHQMEEQLAQLRSESLKLQDTNQTLQSKLNETQSAFHTQISQLRVELVDVRSEAEQAQSQAEHWKQVAERLREENAALEKAEHHGATASASNDETETLKDQLSRTSHPHTEHIITVQRLEAMQTRLSSENARLSEACQRTEILRESNRSLEGKLKRMDALQDEILRKDQEFHALRAEQDQWYVKILIQASSSAKRDTDRRACRICRCSKCRRRSSKDRSPFAAHA